MTPQKTKKTNKGPAALIITLSVFGVVGLGHSFGAFDYLEYKTYDLRVKIAAESLKPSEDIMVVLVTQDCINWAKENRGWGWPWPRKAYGELLDYMRSGGASAVAFDILFTEPSVLGPADDQAFMESAADFGKSVQSVFFSAQIGQKDVSAAWPANLQNKPLLEPAGFGDMLQKYDVSQGGRIGAQFPVDQLCAAAGVIANVTGTADADDVYRRNSLFALFDGKAVPGLSAGAVLAGGAPAEITYNKKKHSIEWGNYEIPVDKNGKTLLRFRGATLDRYIPYTIEQILRNAEAYANGDEHLLPEELLLPPENFKDKYVFIAYYAPGLFDICTNPLSSVYPGVGMHITMLDNLLQGDFIRESPLWVGLILSLAAIGGITFLVLFSGRIPLAVAGGLVLLVLIGGAGMGAYYGANLWLPVVAPITGMGAAFLTAMLYNYATEGKQKQFIKSAFSQYLSPSVIDQLLVNPERLTLGGERREISIFFSDVQGFTTISEKLDPTKLTELLNDYLSIMTDTILESGGTIDKYEGDAIIAFWNAPLNFEDHAARALKASLACQQLMVERQEYFQNKFGSRLLTRIGLNTGYAVVGNMGSGRRFDYTMIGDSVNLAARLEGLNKQFGTYLMCTETTFKQAEQKGAFFGRKLALVAVVGKKEPVAVWEPMSEEEFSGKKKAFARFDEARDMFYQGEFSKSLPLFEGLISEDKPAFYYAEQCRYYLEHPEEWKGFWQAKTK
ncbi:MAG: adenylate/guanylate cyclase domain-containing protein [Spirochaetaceae bacterium]|jgi:adenylate cyclase|nr:adenylate/guanylate cyclase domain-containing protein [Spirochaetaceae bacterium]